MHDRRLRVAEAIRACWESYNRAHRLAPHVVKAVRHILQCRTAALGGHIHQCDRCGSEVPVYNSCQSRHCPTCQTAAKEEWLDARLDEVLPVQYFHVVFTLSKVILAAIRQALHVPPPPVPAKASLAERILRRTGLDITLCPHCGQGHLRRTDRPILPLRCNSP